MNKSKNQEIIGLIFSIGMILTSTSLLNAKEYPRDRNGNVNVNIIDGVVVANDRVESVIHQDETISIDVDGDTYEDYGVSVDDEVDIQVDSAGYGISVDNDEISVDIGHGGIGINVDDEISVDIGGLLDIGSLIMED
jgi:hypothetical protein